MLERLARFEAGCCAPHVVVEQDAVGIVVLALKVQPADSGTIDRLETTSLAGGERGTRLATRRGSRGRLCAVVARFLGRFGMLVV